MSTLDRDQLAPIIREILAEMLGFPLAENQQSGWVALKDAVKPLGYPSYKALHKDVAAGLFRMGKEVRDRRTLGANQAVLQINLDMAQKRLMEDPANRRAV
jgi:hypothetical protein